MHPIHFVTRWNAEILAVANFFIAFGTIVLAAGIPWSIGLSRRDERNRFYATLDQTYFEIQKMVVDQPHLCQTNLASKTTDQILQYDAFAFMSWNFIESIYDYAIMGEDENLRKTWECILHYEAKLHRTWFMEPRNAVKFKRDFRDWIISENCFCDEPEPEVASRSDQDR
jgi:hypothetical protein